MNNVFRKTQLVELVVVGVSGGNQQTNLQFTPQTYLQDKRITSIETFTATDQTKSPSGNALVTGANMKLGFLTLYYMDPDNTAVGGQFMQYRPLFAFHRLSNGTDPFEQDLFEFGRYNIIWEKSFVTLTAALANTTNLSFIFDVGYTDK